MFLEALHHFTVHNITWRALPGWFAKWNSVWKRFGKAAVFEDSLAMLAGLSGTAHLMQILDSTVFVPTCPPPVQGRASRAGARAAARRLRHQDPSENRP